MRDIEFYTPMNFDAIQEVHHTTIEKVGIPTFVFAWMVLNSIIALLAVIHAF